MTADLDLNLLRVLDAVLAERSVTRAAERLHLSQPAVSHALSRLRTALGDPILVRDGAAMRPTPEGERLAVEVHEVMHRVRTRIAPGAFDPATTPRRFTLALPDALAPLLCAPLLRHLAEHAPMASLELRRLDDDTVAALTAGTLDAAVSVPGRLVGDLCSAPLLPISWQAIVTLDHPLEAGEDGAVGLAELARWPHATVAGTGIDTAVGVALTNHGLTRTIGVALTTAALVPAVVAETQLVGFVPSGTVHPGVRALGLPDAVTPVGHDLHWAASATGDRAIGWFLTALRTVHPGGSPAPTS